MREKIPKGAKMLKIGKKQKAQAGVSNKFDICEGPLAKNIMLYTLPLMATGVLQLLFNAADTIVVGRYAAEGELALAAVGATGALINLIVNVLMGLSVGASVNIAHCFGANDKKGVSEAVHTSILTALIGGILVGAIGFLFSKNFLSLMSTPADIIDKSAMYMKIYFLGLPASMVYNFSASILRSTGDTKRPMYFLVTSGVINIILNLILVIGFGLDVEGVAIATVASQLVSAVLCIIHLMKVDGPQRLYLKKLRIHVRSLKKILFVGIPAGLQGSVFSLSNVLIQSSINSFESLFITGNTAGSNIESFIYMIMNAYYHTALTFVGQHVGAKKFDRVKKVVLYCCLFELVTALVVGYGVFFLRRPLLRIYIPSNETAVAYGALRLTIICTTYFTCGLQDTLTGCLRGLGSSVTPMLISTLGVCGFRILWIYTVFRVWHDPTVLFISYPISWVLTAAAELVAYIIIKRNLIRKLNSAVTID